MKRVLILIIKFYRIFISPILVSLFGKACRYTPTCSQYAAEAIENYGVIKGSQLAIRRLLSCNPWYHTDYEHI